MWRLLLLAGCAACCVRAMAANPFVRNEGDAPFVVAHGGFKHLFPENTMVAFEGAVRLGADMLEMDVRLTGDGVLITHHDAALQRTSDGEGRVIDFTLEELRKFNFGAKFAGLDRTYPYRERHVAVTTLDQVLIRYGGTMRMMIEIKGEGDEGLRCAAALAALLRAHGVEDRVIVSAFDDKVVRCFRRESQSRVQTAMGRRHIRRFVILNKLGMGFLWRGRDRSLQIPVRYGKIGLDNPRLVRTARCKGISVYYWTINRTEEMERLAVLGADGVMTDRADLVPQGWIRTSSD